jgi:hypothetical protein
LLFPVGLFALLVPKTAEFPTFKFEDHERDESEVIVTGNVERDTRKAIFALG